VLGDTFLRAPGGKGANQAVAAARLGASVTLVALVGDDDLGRSAMDAYQTEGIDTRYVTVDSRAPSGVALIVVDDRGENAIAVAPGANNHLSVEDVAAARTAIESADMLLVQLEIPLDSAVRAIELAHAAGTRVVLNPAPAQHLPPDVLSLVDILTPNESEAQRLAESLGFDESSGVAEPLNLDELPSVAEPLGVANASARCDANDHAARLLAAGVQTVLVTLGARGVLWAEREAQVQRLPAPTVEAVDSTGAGDAFNGALAVALANGDNLETAITSAQSVAAWSVGRHGAQPSFPTLADLARKKSR